MVRSLRPRSYQYPLCLASNRDPPTHHFRPGKLTLTHIGSNCSRVHSVATGTETNIKEKNQRQVVAAGDRISLASVWFVVHIVRY